MATKTYDHAVIYNGKFYPANTPIKVKEEPKEVVTQDERSAGKKSKSRD